MTRRPRCVIAGRPCPENDDPAKGDYCPWWWGINEQNDDTGQTRVRQACGARYLPKFLTQYDAHMEEAAQSVQSNRNETARGLEAIRADTVDGFRRVGSGIGSLIETVKAAQAETNERIAGLQKALPEAGDHRGEGR